MKMYILLICTLASFANLSAQELMNTKKSCSYYGKLEDTSSYVYNPNKRMENVMANILDASNIISVNIILKESDVDNAMAVLDGANRYILYNPEFMDDFEANARTKWAAYAVLAHEVGHHLNGHLLTNTDSASRHKMELDADIFSGAMLRILGASLFEAQSGLVNYLHYKSTISHPSKNERLGAIALGWVKQDKRMNVQTRLQELRPTFESFRQYTESLRRFHEFEEFFFKILPTREDCAALFVSQADVEKFYAYVIEIKSIKPEYDERIIARFNYQPFTMADIRNNLQNYPGGMANIFPKLKGERTFYTVEILENGKKYGTSYSVFTVVGDRWVFLPKPWRAFND